MNNPQKILEERIPDSKKRNILNNQCFCNLVKDNNGSRQDKRQHFFSVDSHKTSDKINIF